MDSSTLLELMTNDLRDTYDAEKQLTKALPRLAKAASDEELVQGFREHAAQTQEQARRLEQAFQILGMKARSKPCAGMKGLVEEGQELIQEQDEESLDLALCAAARKVEHYEIVAYESLILAAQAAKQTEVMNLFKETLREETEMDKRLATIGKRLFKQSTRKPPQAEAEEEAPAKRSSARKQAGGESASRTPNGRQASGRQSAQATNAQVSKKSASGKANRTASKSESATKGRSSNGRTTNGSGHSSNTTTDPEEIRRWAEERGGQPACVMGTGGKGDIGLLRLEFPGTPNANDDKLTPISWEDFFEKFEERGLALVYQEQTAEGERSNFNKIVSREPENEAKTGSGSGRSRSSR